MKIVFMGTPDFAKESLEAVYEAKYDILGVVTNPDKPQGRGMKMTASPVKTYAIEKGMPIYQPKKVRGNDDFINELSQLAPDVLVVVAYGKILPQEVLDIPKYGAINVHGSLLPQYRGAAPIQWAVLNGDKETGITTMFMDAGMDTGDMILKQKTEIGENETTGELWDRLSTMGAELLVKTLEKIEQCATKIDETKDIKSEMKKLIGAERQGDNFTTAPMLNKEMAKIDWKKSAQEIHNLVRGLNPIMGAQATIKNKNVKIWKTIVVQDQEHTNIKAGEIISADKKGLLIQTGDGAISIIEIQPENKKRMNYRDFLNGCKL